MRAGSQGHHYFFMTGWSVRKANKMQVLAWNQRKQGGDPWGSMVLPLVQQILLPAPQNPLPLPSHLQPSAIQQPYIFQSERFWLQNLSGVNFTHSILVSPHIWKNTKILHGDFAMADLQPIQATSSWVWGVFPSSPQILSLSGPWAAYFHFSNLYD